jgi:AraC-like DNA-binding protein
VWWERPDFAVWSVGRNRQGWAMWGQVGTDAAEEGKQLWLASARRLARPYDLVLDLRPLQSVSQGAFELIREYALTPKRGLRRHAILVGDAQPGTVQLGLYSLAPPAHEWRAFRDAQEAGRWLEWPDAPEIFAAVEKKLVRDDPPMVASVKRHLRAQLEDGRVPDVAETAAALGASVRALQRALGDVKTSFSELLDRARVDRASALLTEPAVKLEAVARAVGFADSKALVRLFRRVKGEGPLEARKRLQSD